ncbi:MAG: hypothetical protein ACYCZY_10670 [Lacisediminihabitans sp.]
MQRFGSWAVELAREREVHDFHANYLDGAVRAGDDAADARWFTPEELPDLPLTQDLLRHLNRFNVYP